MKIQVRVNLSLFEAELILILRNKIYIYKGKVGPLNQDCIGRVNAINKDGWLIHFEPNTKKEIRNFILRFIFRAYMIISPYLEMGRVYSWGKFWSFKEETKFLAPRLLTHHNDLMRDLGKEIVIA